MGASKNPKPECVILSVNKPFLLQCFGNFIHSERVSFNKTGRKNKANHYILFPKYIFV